MYVPIVLQELIKHTEDDQLQQDSLESAHAEMKVVANDFCNLAGLIFGFPQE